jgi:hypothetical protein
MTAATLACKFFSQFWALAARMMASMLEPSPEMRITMFFMRVGLSIGVCPLLQVLGREKEHGRAKNVQLLG